MCRYKAEAERIVKDLHTQLDRLLADQTQTDDRAKAQVGPALSNMLLACAACAARFCIGVHADLTSRPELTSLSVHSCWLTSHALTVWAKAGGHKEHLHITSSGCIAARTSQVPLKKHVVIMSDDQPCATT